MDQLIEPELTAAFSGTAVLSGQPFVPESIRRPRTAFMFSGQGSHYYQMGRELFTREPTFRRWMLEMDELARAETGESVVQALYDPARGKADRFERLLLTHPAIFMIEFALAQTLIQRGIVPECTVATSMGVFAAAAVAGALSMEEVLPALIRQARAVEAHCPSGGMIAVLAEPTRVCVDGFLDRCDIAAENFSTSFVVAAPQSALTDVEEHLRKLDVTYQRLAVSYPFHSRWLDGVRPRLQAALVGLTLKPGRIPMICCAYAESLGRVPLDYFWQVARRPIRFARTIESLELTDSHTYIDVGPSGSLATLLKYILPAGSPSRAASILSPFGQDLRNLDVLAGTMRYTSPTS